MARAVAGELGWPLYTKDTFKELLFDELGIGDVDWSSRLGGAALALLALVIRTELESGRSLVAEANFRRLDRLPDARIVQVFCTDTAEALNERYRARERHPGHLDEVRVIDPAEYAPLPLPGPLLAYSVGGSDVGDLLAAVRRGLGLG